MIVTPGTTRNISHDGITFSYYYFPGTRKKPAAFQVWIDVDYFADLVITKETGFDRLAKNTGIAVEPQTGDRVFDQSCYVACESGAYAQRAFSRAGAREHVTRLFSLGAGRIEHHGSALEAIWKAAPVAGALEQLESIAKSLTELARHFKEASDELGYRKRRRNKRARTARVIIIAVGAFSAFIVWLAAIGAYRLLDPGRLFIYSLSFSIPAFLLFAGLSVTLLRGHATSHRKLAVLLSASLVGFILGMHALCALANGALDSSQGRTHIATVSDKYVSTSRGKKGRRRKKTYYVRFPSWRPGENTVSLPVKKDLYDRVVPGTSSGEVIAKRGALGFEWVSSYTVTP